MICGANPLPPTACGIRSTFRRCRSRGPVARANTSTRRLTRTPGARPNAHGTPPLRDRAHSTRSATTAPPRGPRSPRDAWPHASRCPHGHHVSLLARSNLRRVGYTTPTRPTPHTHPQGPCRPRGRAAFVTHARAGRAAPVAVVALRRHHPPRPGACDPARAQRAGRHRDLVGASRRWGPHPTPSRVRLRVSLPQ